MNKYIMTKDELEWARYISKEFKKVNVPQAIQQAENLIQPGFIWKTQAKGRPKKKQVVKKATKFKETMYNRTKVEYRVSIYKWRGKWHKRKQII